MSGSPCVNIIGAGLAGLSAALELSRMGISSNLISSQPSERAQSVMAEGGINAAMDTMGESDSVQAHFEDTVKGGVYIGEEDSIRGLTQNAPAIVKELIALGVPFDNDNGRLIQRNFGGQKKKRTAYAQSSTGKLIMSALIDEIRKHEANGLVKRFSHHGFESVVTDDSSCCGVIIRDLFTLKAYELKGPVIVAAGGMNSLFPGLTTGSVANTGDVTAYLYSIGVKLSNLEFIQYHPTTAAIEGKRFLITEAARGEGGRLFVMEDGKQRFFMEEKYPELGNLMPRDITAREIASQKGGSCLLDMTHIDKSVWNNKLADLRGHVKHYLGVDPASEYIKVAPGIHYFMGGLYVDRYHKTSMDGLYAAGESACRYHGANRLGGNSMLGALYGGRTAASSASEKLLSGPSDDIREVGIPYEYTDFSVPQSVAEPLARACAITRNEETMTDALRELEELDPSAFTLKDRNRLLLSEAILTSAAGRRESRGAHYRTDYPERDDTNFACRSVIAYDNGHHCLEFDKGKYL